MDNLFRGDCIINQTEVIFFKKKKNKKKQQTPKRCILLITNKYVAFTDPINNNKELVGFPITTITDFTYNQNTDSNFNQYLLEISVFIKNKTHEISIQFPTDNGKQQRDKFIKHFSNNKPKTINAHNHCNETNKQKHATLNGETLRKRANKLAEHKYLSTLYETLVGKNILTATEFWDEYGTDLNDDKQPTSDGLIQGISNNALQSTINKEEWSLFSVFKGDLNNNSNQRHENKLTINLTAEKILQIFINLPEVKLAFDKHVPCHFSEPQFWKSFLQSHYFKHGTTKNITPNNLSSETETQTETEIDKLLKKYMTQLQNEQDVNNENITLNVSDSDGDGDIAMMDTEANKPLKRRKKYAKKGNKLDPAIDLAATMESFVEVMEDPGINLDGNKSSHRDNVQNWFNQLNKHGTMLLDQSLNPRNENTNFTKVNNGRNCATNDRDEKEEDIKMDSDADYDNLDVMNMDYSDRLNIETEFEDLKEECSQNYIELRIEDQSLYWSEHLLLNEKELYEINEYSVKLNDYLNLAEHKKKKLAQQRVKTLILPRFVETTILLNTENNFATAAANLASNRIIQKRKNNYNNYHNNGNNMLVNEEILMIFTQNKEIVANKQILEQLSTFQKQMKELVRHYWHCFPANQQRLRKSQIIVENLKEYKGKLVECQRKLNKKSIEKKIQKILLQELIDLADKVLDHNTIGHV